MTYMSFDPDNPYYSEPDIYCDQDYREEVRALTDEPDSLWDEVDELDDEYADVL